MLAFQEVLEERPMAESVRTTDMSVCLTLTSEEIQALLADNSDLVPGLFQMLCRDSQAGRSRGERGSNAAVRFAGQRQPEFRSKRGWCSKPSRSFPRCRRTRLSPSLPSQPKCA